MKTLEELRSNIDDLLAVSLSDSQMTEALLARVNGTDLRQVLTAALSLARERIAESDYAELEQELEDAEYDLDQAETKLQYLRELLAVGNQAGDQADE